MDTALDLDDESKVKLEMPVACGHIHLIEVGFKSQESHEEMGFWAGKTSSYSMIDGPKQDRIHFCLRFYHNFFYDYNN